VHYYNIMNFDTAPAADYNSKTGDRHKGFYHIIDMLRALIKKEGLDIEIRKIILISCT